MKIIFKGYKCGLNVDYHHAHPLPQTCDFFNSVNWNETKFKDVIVFVSIFWSLLSYS